ncbi:GNAT family N-acetyltransferase [Paenibacillus cremeus]|uniref:GNAT family N-acetyltransferase n=2 Tax=Paenibacillus cremeus TaxID=2163881 RepID=A0A559KDP2_9BACL|nr:GNAT family N-acetyltransferase [Paenibacillus cremeus]
MKHRIGDEQVLELLVYAMVADADRIEHNLQVYKTDASREIYGLEQDGVVLAVAGFTLDDQLTLELHHIAVHPEYRNQGYGRGLLLELLETKQPKLIRAETDEAAVDFYRNVGFQVISLGEKYPGVERFECVYEVEPEDE